MRPIRTIAVGLGPIGCAAARLVLVRPGLELVGAVDVDPGKAGRNLAQLLDLPQASEIAIEGELAAAVERRRPELAILCTGSLLTAVRSDLLTLATAGVNVVSPCEQLLLPALTDPRIADELDRAARGGGATLLGLGVNPGFVLDFLPVILSAVCSRVNRVRAVRIVDAAARRQSLQQKVGAGLDAEEFERRVNEGRLGHVGMLESVTLVGRALGLELDRVAQSVEPVIAERIVVTDFVEVRPGTVAGVRDRGRGYRGDELVVDLELQMYVGAAEPRDEIRIDGEPPLHLRLEGGVPGDQATAALLVNSGPRVVEAEPGLKTILDLPPPRLGA